METAKKFNPHINVFYSIIFIGKTSLNVLVTTTFYQSGLPFSIHSPNYYTQSKSGL